MGAWTFAAGLIEDAARNAGCDRPEPRYAGRAAAASPATGTYERHQEQQARLVDDALTVRDPGQANGGRRAARGKAGQGRGGRKSGGARKKGSRAGSK